MNHIIQPQPCFHIIQTAYNHIELAEKLKWIALNLAVGPFYIYFRILSLYKFSGNFGFEFPDVLFPEEKLPI